MRNIIIAIVVALLLLPVAAKLMPKPLTFERFQNAFTRDGMKVEEVLPASAPGNEAIAQVSMKVDGATVDIYQYEDEGKIAKNYEYQKPDVGQAIVDSMHLAEALGAAKPKNIPTSAARKGMFMLVVASEDGDLRARVVASFAKP